ncbi:MAG: hypothetical protein ACXW15_13290 [Acidimicrobiia bacterium]
MYRRGGIAAILAGLVLGYLFLIWPLHHQTGWVRSRSEVTKVYVACGVPFSILTDRAFSDEARTPWVQEQCVRSARTRLVNIAVLSWPLIVLGGIAFGRGPNRRIPLTQVLRPLPKLIWWRHRSEVQVRSRDDGPADDALQVETARESPERPTPP